jgi:hypothetical protein
MHSNKDGKFGQQPLEENRRKLVEVSETRVCKESHFQRIINSDPQQRRGNKK